MRSYLLIIITIAISILSSCVSSKKMTYFKEVKKDTIASPYELNIGQRFIVSSDELYIRVTSFDEISENPFQMGQGSGNVTDVSLISYTVSEQGYLHLPLLGAVNVKGLTILEAQDKIADELKNYLNRPNVSLRFVNKNVTVLGEVQTPGTYSYSQEQLNVFQALGYANDITPFGNRKEVYVIRNHGEVLSKNTLNLNKDTVFTSDYFFLEDGDVVYVKPLKRRVFGFEDFPFALILSLVSTTILTYSFLLSL